MPKWVKIVVLVLVIITASFLLYSLTGNSGLHFNRKNQEPISERTYTLVQLQQVSKNFRIP